MTDQTPTSASTWRKSSNGVGQVFPVQVPSGNTALLKRPGIQVFFQIGVIPNSLAAIIQKSMDRAQKGRPVDWDKSVQTMLQDPQKLQDILTLVDKVLCFCAVEPKVEMPPDNHQERVEEVLYADEVDLDDKMFIFQWAVGGVSDLESFRSETGRDLESVPASEGLVSSAE